MYNYPLAYSSARENDSIGFQGSISHIILDPQRP